MPTTIFTSNRAQVTTFAGVDPLPIRDRRSRNRIREICDEYLQGAPLTLPRVFIEGRYWPLNTKHSKGGSLGLIICRRILRDSSGWDELFREFAHLLAPGGILYLSAPDRRALIDPDYQLPGLHQLPQAFAEIYLGLAGYHAEPLYRPLLPGDVAKHGDRFDIFDYSKRYLPGVSNPMPGMLEYSLIKRAL